MPGRSTGSAFTGPGGLFEHGTLDGTSGEGKGMDWQTATLPTEQGPVRSGHAAPFSWTGPGETLDGPPMQTALTWGR
jgi:hypothetical protein